ELVLEALDHADAAAAAAALAAIAPRAYRTFNLIIADSRDAFWLRHADETGRTPIEVRPLLPGLAMIASGDLDDPETPRLAHYRPRFLAAPAPDPARDDWSAWEALLCANDTEPARALRFTPDRGFATVSSALIALPSHNRPALSARFRFRAYLPRENPWADVALDPAPPT
ncbi:MAG: NRDE family protein, partial [Stellaceae bacterium]